MNRTLAVCCLALLIAAPAHAVTCPLTFDRQLLTNAVNQSGQMAQLANTHPLIADTYNDRLIEMNAFGGTAAIYGPLIPGYGSLNKPAGVAVDAAGNVYVADQSSQRILRFGPTMNFLSFWNTTPGGYPTNLAFSPDGSTLYVTELLGDRVSMYTPTGALLGTFGSHGAGPGQFDHPFGVAVDASGVVHVADEVNNRIQMFSPTGVYLGEFGSSGSGPGQFSLVVGLRFDAFGDLYAADQLNHRIQRFGPGGSPVCTYGSLGSGNGQFRNPWWAYPLPDGSILVGDTNNFRLTSLVNGVVPTQKVSWGSVKITYR